MKYNYNLNYKINDIIHFEKYIKDFSECFEYSNYYNDDDIIDLFFSDNIDTIQLDMLINNYINPQIDTRIFKFIGGDYKTSDLPFFKTVNTFEYGSYKKQVLEKLYIHSYCIPYNKKYNENDYYQIRLVNVTDNQIIDTINLKNINYVENYLDLNNFICFKNYHWEIQVKCLQPCTIFIKNINIQKS